VLRPRRRCAALLAATLALAAASASASDDFEALLRKADGLRSSEPAAFQALVAELDQRQTEASPQQRQFLRYLQAYGKAFGGDLQAANTDLNALLAEAEDPIIRYRAALSLANNAALTRDFTEGFRALEGMLLLLPTIEDATERRLGLGVAAMFLNQAGQYELGGEYAARVLADAPGGRGECFARYLQLESASHTAPLTLQEASFRETIAFCSDIGEAVPTNLARSLLARHLASTGARPAAIELLLTHQAEAEATRYPVLIAQFSALLAEYQFAEGQLDAADENARRALEVGARLPTTPPLVSARRTLYEVARQRGDLAAALAHYRDYAEADRAYLDDIKARELAYQMARHETQQKTQTIELLNRRNEVLQLEQEVSRRTTQSIGLLAALLAALAASIAYWAFKVKRLQLAFRKLAETDALTGLSNRHHFAREAEQELARCRRNGRPATLIMFDLDRFKSINDRYGHAVGDWVLRKVAEVDQAVCAELGRIGRLGGEEFALLLPGMEAAAAAPIAERLRGACAAIDSSASGHRFDIRASFGIADSSTAGHDLNKLLSQADEAMYRSKREGRDQIRVHTSTSA
jgi:diguanylate cyclase (GGDEF)-like protein